MGIILLVVCLLTPKKLLARWVDHYTFEEIIQLGNYTIRELAIRELEEKQTNGSARIYLIEVNLSRLMGLTRKLNLLVLVSLKALS